MWETRGLSLGRNDIAISTALPCQYSLPLSHSHEVLRVATRVDLLAQHLLQLMKEPKLRPHAEVGHRQEAKLHLRHHWLTFSSTYSRESSSSMQETDMKSCIVSGAICMMLPMFRLKIHSLWLR